MSVELEGLSEPPGRCREESEGRSRRRFSTSDRSAALFSCVSEADPQAGALFTAEEGGSSVGLSVTVTTPAAPTWTPPPPTSACFYISIYIGTII